MSEWKEATVESGDTWDREAPIEGKLITTKENVGPNESRMYVLNTKDGLKSVWGSTVLDTKFEQIPKGSTVRIEPLGKVKSEKTGRSYMDFKVLYKEPEFVEATGEDESIDLNQIFPAEER